MDLQLATGARSCVHLADGEAAAEPATRGAFEACRQFPQRRLVGRWRLLGQRPLDEAAQQDLSHGQRSWPEYEQLNDLLQSGKSATMLPSMAASSSGHWNHEGSRRWQRWTRPSVSSRSHTST